MASGSEPDRETTSGQTGVFATTHWSVVLSAGGDSSRAAQEALEQLCRTYWYPLYAYVRRRGYAPHDAEDLTQSFFARLLEKDYLARADRERGRFRTFLLASLNYFLSDEWDKSRREKRGGGRPLISFDAVAAEDRYRLEPVDPLDPAKIFERRWVTTLMSAVLNRLEQEYRETGRQELFSVLKDFLAGDRGQRSYADVGRQFQLTENAVKQAVHRLRRRYRQLFREEIAQTVADAGEIDDEARHILAVLSN
jgi:RNA polymerase sigma factor (sigma-70 family)